MKTAGRALRRRILTPSVEEVSLDKRGFHRKSPAAQEHLETVGKTFLAGYSYAAEAATVTAAAARLDSIPGQFRGFAYEGAGMGFAMRDALPLGRHDHAASFVTGIGSPHIYTGYVGIGWAMARLPRFRWPDPDEFDPLLRWLALDGWGFHQAFFRTKKYVRRQYRPVNFDWPRGFRAGYTLRGIDHGIGRALWFVEGTDVARVADAVERFAPSRHGDLYAGVGLAATYAGGVETADLEQLLDRAGEHRGALAQGAAFAVEARVRGDIVIPHTHIAAKVFCGTTPDNTAQRTLQARVDLPPDGEVPAYEVWRQRIAAEFVATGGRS